MIRYKIKLIRDVDSIKAKDGNTPPHGYLQISFCWLSAPLDFHNYSDKKKEFIIENRLKDLTINTMIFDPSNTKLEEKERIKVFQQGKYKKGQEVFDSEIEIPERLQNIEVMNHG